MGLGEWLMQKARVPMAAVNLVKIPDNVSGDQALLLSDIFPTGYFGAELADIKPGHTVAVFGCGPVGQFVIASAKHLRAGRIFAIDTVPGRLARARAQGAEVIDYNKEDPIETIQRLTGGIGVDRAIDAVGVDANAPDAGPAAQKEQRLTPQFQREVSTIAPQQHPSNGNWHPGNAPSQVHTWAVRALAKAGTLSIIGVYPRTDQFIPIGAAMMKNLTIKIGNCNHRKYIPMLMELVQAGVIDPSRVLSQLAPISDAIEAYKRFNERQAGWLKVELAPAG